MEPSTIYTMLALKSVLNLPSTVTRTKESSAFATVRLEISSRYSTLITGYNPRP